MRLLIAVILFFVYAVSLSLRPGVPPVRVTGPEDAGVRYSLEQTGRDTYRLDIQWDQ